MVRGVAKMKKTILVVTLIGISVVCLMFAKARFFSTYVVLDPDAEEVQSIVGEINLGIGKGSYDKILIFRGKDPVLVSSCTVPRQVWEQIVSKGETRMPGSIMAREQIVPDRIAQKPLGCYRLNEIDCCGFENGSNNVYLVLVNSGDAGGKFPKNFWNVAVRNQK